MKFKTAFVIVAVVPLLSACASAPLSLNPVGPGPFTRPAATRGMGQLQVYTETEEYYEDQMPWFPHSDYQLYTTEGKRLKRVWNHDSHEDETPAIVTLPPGQYVVKAWAEHYGPVSVPVLIRPNQLTRVLLQPGWKPDVSIARSDLVQMPKGYFVGWRADATPQK